MHLLYPRFLSGLRDLEQERYIAAFTIRNEPLKHPIGDDSGAILRANVVTMQHLRYLSFPSVIMVPAEPAWIGRFCRKRSFIATTWLFLMLSMPFALAETAAKQRHVDRLAILVNEHQDVTRRLSQAEAEAPRNEEKISGLRVSLEALNKEIAFVRKQPVHKDGWNANASNAQAKRIEQKRQSSETRVYDDWDIFHNFGKSVNEKTE